MSALRITGPSPLAMLRAKLRPAEGVSAVDTVGDEGAGSAYTRNLAKLVPGEALSLFAAGSSVEVPTTMAQWRVWPPICLVAALIFRWLATKEQASWKPQWWALLIAGASFVLWIYAQNDWFFSWRVTPDYAFMIKYVMLFWIFVIPAVVKGDK